MTIIADQSRKRSLKAISKAKAPSKAFRRIVSSLPARFETNPTRKTNPQDVLHKTMRSKNMDIAIVDTLGITNFFEDPTSEEIGAYGSDVLTAIRSSNLQQLRQFVAEGRPLKCSNQFGESLLHLACRRGLVDVVAFLIKEAGVTVKVRDDYGRTPLHDACWTASPNFDLISLVVAECPRLLFMTDRRGHTPLSYARQDQWAAWVEFIQSNESLIFPATAKQ